MKTVVVCEGEKSADALYRRGILAVGTVTGASGCPGPESLAALRGFDIVLFPDNDDVGRKHMEKVGAALKGLGIASRTLVWADAPPKGDAADFTGTDEELAALIAAATDGAKALPGSPSREIKIWTADELSSEVFTPPLWAIPGILPAGLTILAGRPKLGKSWLALGWSIDLPTGRSALRSIDSPIGDVLYLALEDGPRRIQERLALILGECASPHGLSVATDWPRMDEGGNEKIEEWLLGHENARLVVIDTFKRVRPLEKKNARLYDGDYDAIAPVAALALRLNVAIVAVFHTNKSQSTDPVDLVSGTLGLSGAADCVMVLRRERGQADASLFITGRDVEEQDLALKWDTVDEFGWRLLGQAEDFRRSRERQVIVDVVIDTPGLSPAEIASALGKTAGSVRYLLFKMVQEGEVRSRDGKYFPGTNDHATQRLHAPTANVAAPLTTPPSLPTTHKQAPGTAPLIPNPLAVSDTTSDSDRATGVVLAHLNISDGMPPPRGVAANGQPLCEVCRLRPIVPDLHVCEGCHAKAQWDANNHYTPYNP